MPAEGETPVSTQKDFNYASGYGITKEVLGQQNEAGSWSRVRIMVGPARLTSHTHNFLLHQRQGKLNSCWRI
jgi:hypothetical protein